MRRREGLAVGLVVVMLASGCAMRDRKWGSCAIAGGILGAAIGGITGGVVTNNVVDDASDGLEQVLRRLPRTPKAR